MVRILVADDEPIERMVVMKKIKQQFGQEVEILEAENGREVVEQFKRAPFHIAVLDIEMPGTDGLDAANEIRRLNGECEIIFLTAFDEFQYARMAITVRALDYLLKPVSEEELFLCLEEAMQRIRYHIKYDRVAGAGIMECKAEELPVGKNRQIGRRIMQYIETHYGEDISLQELADHLNYSEAYFSTVFKQCFDENFTIFLSRYRVEKAMHMLEDVTINVKEISESVGYRDPNYFAKVFKRITGVTPTDYRKQFV